MRNIDFVSFLKKSVIISAAVILIGVVLTCIFGVKLDINFAGGSVYSYSFTGDIDTDNVQKLIEDKLGATAKVTKTSDYTGESQRIVISFSGDIVEIVDEDKLDSIIEKLEATSSETNTSETSSTTSSEASSVTSSTESATSSEASSTESTTSSEVSSTETSSNTSSDASSSASSTGSATSSTSSQTTSTSSGTEAAPEAEEANLDIQNAITAVLKEAYPDNEIVLSEANSVNPSLASSFLIKGLVAVILAAALVVVYIAIRFRKIGGWTAALSTLVALVHDVVISFFAMSIFGLAIDINYFAVVLTLFGYSLNATIVIFDRVRENKKFYPELTVREGVNRSINETLARSIMTAITTVASILAIIIVAEFFGVTALRSFAIPMSLGIISGCYTSVFLSGPIWVAWKEKKTTKTEA